MTEQQIKQAQEAVRICDVVAGVAALNRIDRNNSDNAIAFLRNLLAEESQPKLAPENLPTA